MNINVLSNFLAIAREGSMTAAAEVTHMSQSTLSVQMKQLEEELGKKLFRKQGRFLVLTEEGMLLRKRAEEILSLVDKTLVEFNEMDGPIGGTVRFGCAETWLVHHISDIFLRLQSIYPLLQFDITSGNSEQVLEKIEGGLFEFGLLVEEPNPAFFNSMKLPDFDRYGVLMPESHPLATKEYITFEDLLGESLIMSKQAMETDMRKWCGEGVDQLHVSVYYNLFYNGSVFVNTGVGIQVLLEHLMPEAKGMTFRPLYPQLACHSYLIWKKYQVFSPIAQIVLEAMKEHLKEA